MRSSFKCAAAALMLVVLLQGHATATDALFADAADTPLTTLGTRVQASLKELAPVLKPQLHAAGVKAVWDGFERKATSWSRPWSLYILNEWCRKHLS